MTSSFFYIYIYKFWSFTINMQTRQQTFFCASLFSEKRCDGVCWIVAVCVHSRSDAVLKKLKGKQEEVFWCEKLRKLGCAVPVHVAVTGGKPAVGAADKRRNHFSNKAAEAWTPTLTFSDSVSEIWEGCKRQKKSAEMPWCLRKTEKCSEKFLFLKRFFLIDTIWKITEFNSTLKVLKSFTVMTTVKLWMEKSHTVL